VLVIQFGIPSSLEVWTQQAGRAGRQPDLQARAVLMAEQSMFQRRKPAKKKKRRGHHPGDEEQRSSSSSDESSSEGERQRMEWGKAVDPHLREWIETDSCRCDITDKYFGNPKERKGEFTALIVIDKQKLTTFPSAVGQLL